MGYYMNQGDTKFFIAKKDLQKVLDVIKLLMTKVNELGGGGSSTGERWFSFTDTKRIIEAETLVDALEGWRYCATIDKYGNINNIEFTGEKSGQDKLLFDTIAPFVRDSSYIKMIGEDGAKWKWAFREGKCIRE